MPAAALEALRYPLLVLNSRDANLSVIDPVTWTVKSKINTGKEPHHLYLTPDKNSVIVANAGSDSLTFIDPKTALVQRTVTGIRDPYHLRFSPDMKWFVTAANRLNHVDVYQYQPDAKDAKQFVLAKRIPTTQTPSHLWIDGKSKTVFVTMQDSNELIAIDLATQNIRWRQPTGQMPADVFGTADDKFILVGLTAEDSVEVFDVSGALPKLHKKFVTGKGAHAFRSAGDKRHLFVSNRVANTVSKVDLQNFSVVASYATPAGPDCMDVSSNGKYLMLTARWAKLLTVIDTTTGKVIKNIPVGNSPHGVWTLDHIDRL